MKRIRYISIAVSRLSSTQIAELVKKAQTSNATKNITGMLVATGALFFQLLEGPDADVDALFEKIKKDSRHTNVLLLASETGDFDRICPDWAMHSVDLSEVGQERVAPVKALLKVIFAQQKLLDEAITALEEYTWRSFIDAELASMQ